MMRICLDPLHPRRALWTVPMRHVISVHIPEEDERLEVSACIERAYSARGVCQDEDADPFLDKLRTHGGNSEGVLVVITCCNYAGAAPAGSEVALGSHQSGRRAACYRSDVGRHVRVIESGSLFSHLVLCASLRAAQRLERTLTTLFQLFDPSPSLGLS
jgi:hypothetical protein